MQVGLTVIKIGVGLGDIGHHPPIGGCGHAIPKLDPITHCGGIGWQVGLIVRVGGFGGVDIDVGITVAWVVGVGAAVGVGVGIAVVGVGVSVGNAVGDSPD